MEQQTKLTCSGLGRSQGNTRSCDVCFPSAAFEDPRSTPSRIGLIRVMKQLMLTTFILFNCNIFEVITYLSCLVSWAALRSSCMFLVICSVLQMTSSVHGRVASSSPSSPGSTASEAGRGLLRMKRKYCFIICIVTHTDTCLYTLS